MSKKIMKRSLALGALMAFVITGSVSAATYGATGSPYENRSVSKSEEDVGDAYGFYSVTNGEGVTISGATFQNNTTIHNGSGDSYGGVMYVIGDLEVTDSEFIGNSAYGSTTHVVHGGAIAQEDGKLKISGSTFNGNKVLNSINNNGTSADSYGSAIYSENAIVEISNSIFENQDGGRAVYIRGNKGATFTNNEFKNNKRGSIQAQDTTTVLNFEGKNEFINNVDPTGVIAETLFNKGTTNFKSGSETIFSGNQLDIKNNGIVNIEKGATVTLGTGMTGTGTTNINGGTLELAGGETNIAVLGGKDGVIHFSNADAKLTVETNENKTLKFTATSAVNEAVGGDANKLISNVAWVANTTMVMDPGDIVGKVTAELGNKDGKLFVISKTEEVNPANQAVSNVGFGLKLFNRAHMNDMNKRMGELRDANGEHGVWARMVRGESEYENVKAQYNQYQLGYDEKLSVDKRWTVGAAVTFAEGEANYGYGSTEDKSTAFAIYGSKLNDDGTFVDLIARYAHIESDVDDQAGEDDMTANGMSVSAEFGKRIQQGNGLWVEPQVEFTYGTLEDAEMQLGNKTVQIGDVDSLIGRVGFRIGQDIEKGNVYARASYLYDFDSEAETSFTNGSETRSFKDDLGGGWWEVGVGANINLSKATYIYADVEKTFGGEVDTNWQWNLGVRYSF